MKILVIQVGNFVPEDELIDGVEYLKYPTLLYGHQYFDKKQIINNVQTRQSIEVAGFEVSTYFHTNRKGLKDLLISSWKIRQLEKCLRPELTHIYWGGISGLFASIFLRGKSIISYLGSDMYGSYDYSGRKILSSRVQTIASRLNLIFSSRIVVMSFRMKRFLGGWNKIRVIPEGIDSKKFYPMDQKEARKKLGWVEDAFYLLFFYEGQAVKNEALALATSKLLKTRIPGFELAVIQGFRHDDLVYVYNAGNCLINTSLHEGSNNSIKEALACNLPVVSVPCGDAEERLGSVKNCFVVEYNEDLLADAIQKVYENGGRSDGVLFTDEITLESSRNKLIELYKETI